MFSKMNNNADFVQFAFLRNVSTQEFYVVVPFLLIDLTFFWKVQGALVGDLVITLGG
jgi:hypothetical protein